MKTTHLGELLSLCKSVIEYAGYQLEYVAGCVSWILEKLAKASGPFDICGLFRRERIP